MEGWYILGVKGWGRCPVSQDGHHKSLHSLNNRSLSSHSSGGQKSKATLPLSHLTVPAHGTTVGSAWPQGPLWVGISHFFPTLSVYSATCMCQVTLVVPSSFNPIDWSPPGSSVHGILQVRRLEWVAVPSDRGSSRPGDRTRISCIGRRVLYH